MRVNSMSSLRSIKTQGLVSFLTRYCYWLTFILLAVTAIPLGLSVGASTQGDVRLYYDLADSLMVGAMPYEDFEFGYPPYAIPILLLPRLFQFGIHYDLEAMLTRYQFTFALLALTADSALKFLLLFEGSKRSDRVLSFLPLALYCGSVPFLHYFYLQRYDVFPSLITAGAICLFARGWFGWSGACLIIGAGMKLYPALLVPALWSLAAKRQEGLRFVAGCGWALIPLALLSFFLPWWRFLAGHIDRVIQAESLYASIIWLLHLLGGVDATWSVKIWMEVQGPLAQAFIPGAKAVMISTTAASIAFSAWVGSRRAGLKVYQIARLMLVPLLCFVGFNLTFSPQYMIWLLPFSALGLLGGTAWPMVMIAVSTAVIPIFYPSPQYISGLDLGQTLVLLCRNLCLLI